MLGLPLISRSLFFLFYHVSIHFVMLGMVIIDENQGNAISNIFDVFRQYTLFQGHCKLSMYPGNPSLHRPEKH